ncbi:MAG: tetratricopeptide repeat protein [Candidatus Omnitrophica bacterium]|nr:tetratricopeptide repeat protein [Candidatus Omnitrophota bacterium]
MINKTGSLNRRFIIVILFTACFLVYFNSLDGVFISDDIPAIARNPELLFPWRFWMEPASLLNSLNLLIAGHNPFTYHLTSVLLHALNTILAFFFLSIFFGLEPSFLGALIFAVHPIHTEAVSWISGKPYLILFAFTLGNTLLYQRAVKEAKRLQPIAYLFVLLIFYYMTIRYYTYYLFPFLLILLDLTLGRARRNWRLWLPFFILAGIRFTAIRFQLIHRVNLLSGGPGVEPAWNNPILTVAHSLFSNLGLLFWPFKLTLYHEPIIASGILLGCEVILLFVFILSLIPIFKKEKILFFVLVFFILFISPTFSPIPISWMIAERYLYLPSLSLSLFSALIYDRYASRGSGLRNKILFLLVLIIAGYALRTILRNEDWRDPKRFWRQELKISPGSASVHNKMGDIYRIEGDFVRAIEELNKSLVIKPKDANAYNNLGVVYSDMGDKGEAASYYLKALEVNPKFTEAYFNLGNAYAALGKNKEAISSYRKALELKQDFLEACINLGVAYQNIGNNKESIIAYQKALQISPRAAIVHNNLAAVYYKENEYALAIKHLDLATKFGYQVNPEFLRLLEAHRKP